MYRSIGFSGETLKDLGLEEDTKILENNKALSRFTSLDPLVIEQVTLKAW